LPAARGAGPAGPAGAHPLPPAGYGRAADPGRPLRHHPLLPGGGRAGNRAPTPDPQALRPHLPSADRRHHAWRRATQPAVPTAVRHPSVAVVRTAAGVPASLYPGRAGYLGAVAGGIRPAVRTLRLAERDLDRSCTA